VLVPETFNVDVQEPPGQTPGKLGSAPRFMTALVALMLNIPATNGMFVKSVVSLEMPKLARLLVDAESARKLEFVFTVPLCAALSLLVPVTVDVLKIPPVSVRLMDVRVPKVWFQSAQLIVLFAVPPVPLPNSVAPVAVVQLIVS